MTGGHDLTAAADALAALAQHTHGHQLPDRLGPVHLEACGTAAHVWLTDLHDSHDSWGPATVATFDVTLTDAGTSRTWQVETDTRGDLRSVHGEPGHALPDGIAGILARAVAEEDQVPQPVADLVTAAWTWRALRQAVHILTGPPGYGLSSLLGLLPGGDTAAAMAPDWTGDVAGLLDAAARLTAAHGQMPAAARQAPSR